METLSNIDLGPRPITLKVIGIGDDEQPISLGDKKPVWAFDPADIVQADLSADWTQAVLSRKTPGTVTVSVTVDSFKSPPVIVQVHAPELAGLAIQAVAAADGPASPATV